VLIVETSNISDVEGEVVTDVALLIHLDSAALLTAGPGRVFVAVIEDIGHEGPDLSRLIGQSHRQRSTNFQIHQRLIIIVERLGSSLAFVLTGSRLGFGVSELALFERSCGLLQQFVSDLVLGGADVQRRETFIELSIILVIAQLQVQIFAPLSA